MVISNSINPNFQESDEGKRSGRVDAPVMGKVNLRELGLDRYTLSEIRSAGRSGRPDFEHAAYYGPLTIGNPGSTEHVTKWQPNDWTSASTKQTPDSLEERLRSVRETEQAEERRVTEQWNREQQEKNRQEERVASLPKEFHEKAAQLAALERNGDHDGFDKALQTEVGKMEDPDHWKVAQLLKEINQTLPPDQQIAVHPYSIGEHNWPIGKAIGYVDMRTPEQKALDRSKSAFHIRHESGIPGDPDSWMQTPGTHQFSVVSKAPPELERAAERSWAVRSSHLGEERWYSPGREQPARLHHIPARWLTLDSQADDVNK